jgi:hypothetical protein
MRHNLSEGQLSLAEFMSSLSEAGFDAGWMQGLEFDLWDILDGDQKLYGRYMLTPKDIEQLKLLSSRCGCWITFNDEKEEVAVPMEVWKKTLANRR